MNKKIVSALQLAMEKYDKKTYEHAMRVAGYVAEQDELFLGDIEDAIIIAILHDLIEDTDVAIEDIKVIFGNSTIITRGVFLLTKPKDMSYINYCQRLKKESAESLAGICAYRVKLADMKDHLNLKETLTDKLKEKYLAGLAELL